MHALFPLTLLPLHRCLGPVCKCVWVLAQCITRALLACLHMRVGASAPFAHVCKHQCCHQPHSGCARPACLCTQVLAPPLCMCLFCACTRKYISMFLPFLPGCQPGKIGELFLAQLLAQCRIYFSILEK